MGKLRANRDFQLLWWGRALSLLGDSVLLVVLPLTIVTQPRGNAIWAGGITSAMALASVLVRLPAGLLSDHWDARKIMLACDAGCLAAMVALTAMVYAEAAPVILLGPAIAMAALASLFVPAATTAVRRLVPPEQLPSVLGLSEARSAVLAFIGFPLGGVLYALSRSAPLMFEAVTYAGSLLAVLAIRTPLRGCTNKRAPLRVSAALEGLRFLLHNRVLFVAAWHAAVINMIFGGLGLATVIVVVDHANGSASGITSGWMMALASSGSVVGASVAGSCSRWLSVRWTILLVSVLGGLMASLMAFTTSPLAIGLLLAACYAAGPLETVAVSAYQLRITPDDMTGRVSAALSSVAMCASPLGPLLTGVFLDWGGTQVTFELLGGMLCALAVLVAILFPQPAAVERSSRQTLTPSPTRTS